MAGFKEYQMLFSLNAKTESGFQAAFSAGSSEVARLQAKINDLNKTQGNIDAYQKQQNAIDKTRSKIELYQTQLANLRNATASTSKEEAELANAIAAKEKQLSDSEKTLAGQEGKLNEMSEALKQAGVNTDNLGSASEMLTAKTNALKQAQMEEAKSAGNVSDAMQGLQSILVAIGAEKALNAMYEGLKSCSESAAEFETAMASVKRTVGGNDAFIADLGDSFQTLSTQMPITASELAAIAATAGQLGIAQADVGGFTEVMAKLATTTDLTADSAATMLAQFANITGTTDYDRLGATVAALGDSTATTASKVVEMSQGMAAAANVAGMSETDILAIAAAVGSLGIESQAGSTAMSQLITTLYKATETGDGLEEFASVAGLSAEQFKQAWGADAVSAMDAFIQGLNDTTRNGRSAMVILDELGISNVRQVKAILGLASAGDLLSNTISQANSAWASNTALAEKAGIMYNTTGAKLAMLQNSANNVSVAIGDALNPAVGGAADLLTGLVQPIADFIAANPALIQGMTASAGVLGVVTAAVAAYEAKAKLAAIATKILGTSMSGHFGAILAVAGGVGALVTALGLLSGAGRDTGASFEELNAEYEQLSDSITENQNIIDLVDQYKKLSKEVAAIGDLDPEDIKLKATIENKGVTQENLNLIDELKKRIDSASGELKQILTIAGAEDVSPENLSAIANLAASATDGDHELKQQLALLGAGDISDEDMQRLKDLSGQIVDDTATLQQNLKLTGFESYEDMKKAAELPVSSKTADIIVNLKEEGYENVSQKLTDIGAQAIATQNEIDAAKSTLSDLQGKASELQDTIDNTKRKSQKLELEKELAEVNEQIEAQQAVIETLESTHSDLVTQYEATSAAAQEVMNKESALATTKEQLAAATGGVIAATEEETIALYEQLAAQKEVENAQKRTQLYGNLSQQAGKYAQAVTDAAAANAAYQEAMAMVNTSLEFAGKGAEDVNKRYQELLATLDQMQSAEGFDPSDADFQSTIDQVEALRNIFQGYSEELNQYAGDMISWVDSFSYLGTNETHWNMMLEEMNASVIEYKNSLDSATTTQNDFLDSIADSVLSGAVPIEEVERRLMKAWEDEENQAELVAGVMDYVNGLLEAQAAAAADAAAANEELADSSGTVNETTVKQAAAIEDTIQQIEDLKKAYEDAYNAAYESMGGQFDLFDKASKISVSKHLKKDLGDYKAGLESQAQYMKDYAKNYEEAAKAVENANPDVSSSFMSQLTDGSAESAQILANLAAAAPEDVKAIVQAYADAQKAREQYATNLAEAQTNFSETMSGLQTELTTTVQAMDFSTQASANAKTALNAFVNAASSYIGPVSAAYARVAAAAAAALKFNPTLVLPQGYASGTDSAEAGLRLVGEEGPELVMFKGGEQVLNAQETEKALNAEPIGVEPASPKGESGGGEGSRVYNVNVSIPSINASGTDAGELLIEITDKLKDTIIDTLEEYNEDQERRDLR